MKSTIFGITSSILLSCAIAPVAEAASLTTLPDPMADPSITSLWVAGGRNSFIDTADQNGQYSIFDLYVPPNVGPPLHFHKLEYEWFYVVDGNPLFQKEEDVIQGEPGTLLYSPIGQLHAFKNKTPDPVRMLLFYGPKAGDPDAVGNIERFFKDERVGQEVVDPFTPPPFNPAELLTAGPEYGLIFPSTFVFTMSEFFGNEISILRTGDPSQAASVTVELSNGEEILVNFEAGEYLKHVAVESNFGNPNLDLILTNPSDGSYLGLLDNQAVLTAKSVPEYSSPVGFLALGIIGFGLMLKRPQKTFSPDRQFPFDPADKPEPTPAHS